MPLSLALARWLLAVLRARRAPRAAARLLVLSLLVLEGGGTRPARLPGVQPEWH